MDAVRVNFALADGRKIVASTAVGTSLLDSAKHANVPIDAPCAGNMTCGKCRVRVVRGEVESPKNRHINDAESAQGWVLACVSTLRGDIEVEVPVEASAYQSGIRVSSSDNPREEAARTAITGILARLGHTLVEGYELREVSLSVPTLDDAQADQERLLHALAGSTGVSEERISVGIGALRVLPHALRETDFTVVATIQTESNGNLTILDVSSKNEAPLGLAIDIGTTTVSALLTDLSTGQILASGSAGNGQIRFGADVINRLIESTRAGGLERLREAIVTECLQPLVRSLVESINRRASSIVRVAVAGNTTMIHLFTGVYGNHLRLEPYVPAFFSLEGLRGSELMAEVNPDARVLLAPAVGSYVGGDITAGVLASMIGRSDSFSMLIDLGTNGEIVFGNSDFLMACACSAGPAFEGGDISCGMRATDGAIEALEIDDATMNPCYKVIGEPDQKPRGVCGSGLIDAIGELYRTGIIDARGRFQREGDRIRKDEWGSTSYIIATAEEADGAKEVALNDADIENFIRAKGSVFSAIRTILAIADMDMSVIEHIYIAGGIGSAIDIEHAVGVGMLPNIPREGYSYIGNTSLAGSYAILSASEAYDELCALANNITYVELSSMPSYMDEFVAACFLPHTDASLFSR
ncbi:MAG: ASKHA domain-containing protein [Coriobacteriales bacterium]|jgi:uncharacterized 2Fe-2S/4Fe-4S cluster protein (DUF4445 family)|nr:ASKHA domain-containing protein [Coriobacteriales bacterium]